MTASDSLFDSRVGFLGQAIQLRDVAIATNFGTKIAITGFV